MASKRVAVCCASSGLSMISPISVLRWFDRWSKFIEPTYSLCGRTRTVSRAANSYRSANGCRFAAASRVAQHRAHFVELHAVFQQRHPIVHVAGLRHQLRRRLERVGQNANFDAPLAQVPENPGAAPARNQIRRHHQQLGLGLPDMACATGWCISWPTIRRPVPLSCPDCRRPPARAPRRAAIYHRLFRPAAHRTRCERHSRCRLS